MECGSSIVCDCKGIDVVCAAVANDGTVIYKRRHSLPVSVDSDSPARTRSSIGY